MQKAPQCGLKQRSGKVAAFLRAYAAGDPARFHMPGHKGRTPGCEHDITELPGADNLMMPGGILRDAQHEAAQAFGARHSFFVTGGATTALIAALLSLPPNAALIAARDCHKSAIAGMALAGLDAAFLPQRWDGHAPALPDAAAIEAAIARHPNACAVLITRPDYYGRCADLAPIAALCRKNRLALIVDEAHGSHFRFSPALPETAAEHAALYVNSAHKTLAAPNQAAYLHIGHGACAPDPARVAKMLALIHTSSPSYPILAALDDAWRTASDGSWTEHLARLEAWRRTLPERWRQALWDGAARDRSRLVFDCALASGLSGYDAERGLNAAGVYVEMADERHIVLITSPLDPAGWYDRLADALQALPRGTFHGTHATPPPAAPTRAMSIREATLREAESVALEEAVGRVAAESIGVYPPGVALIAPGEVIDAATLTYLLERSARGAQCFGLPIRCVARAATPE